MPTYQAKSIIQTTSFAPSQWHVGALPKPLYIRYRWGWLTVREDDGDELGDDLLTLQCGHQFDGEMETEDMMKHTEALIDWTKLR